MPVREAKLSDRAAVQRLLTDALVEESIDGSDMLPTGRSVQFGLDYFHSYTVGSRFGACLLWSPEGEPAPRGFILMGERWEEDGYDRDVGRSAWVWNFYVEPEQRGSGAGMALAKAAKRWATEAGFDTVTFNIPAGAQSTSICVALGAVPRGVWYAATLRPLREVGA